MLRKDGPLVGVYTRDAAAGETVEVQTIGADVIEDQKLAQVAVAGAFDDAGKAGIRPPGPFIVAEVQVFYCDGRPVEARVAGHIAKVDHWTEDQKPVYLFPVWSSDPAPRWAEDGGLLPEDAARPHLAVKSTSVTVDGELKPVLRRSWNFAEHANPWLLPWRDLRDLAEAEAELPEDLQAVARLVLEVLAGNAEENARYALTEPGAPFRDRLVRELKKRLRELRRVSGLSGTAPPAADVGADVTEAAAKWLAETFPTEGAKSAEELRRRAEVAPWAPWWSEDGQDFAFLLRRLVSLTWRNGLEAEAERARRNRPGLVRGVYAGELVAVQTAQISLPTLEPRELRDRRGRLVATIDASVADLPLVHDGLDALRSPVGNRLVKNLVLTAHRQAEAKVPDFRTVHIEGGWQAVADALFYSKRDFKPLKALATAGQYVNWESRDGIHKGGGWWLFSEKRGGPGAPGHVRFTLADCFLPKFASSLKQDSGHALSAREARRLVPELPYEPPTGAVHEHHQGAVWTLHRLFLLELVDCAEELTRNGVVVVSAKRWRELAEVAGLPLGLLPKVHDSWTEGESERAPKMVERDGDEWRLALDVYRLEHEFLVASGQRRIEGGKGGRKGGGGE